MKGIITFIHVDAHCSFATFLSSCLHVHLQKFLIFMHCIKCLFEGEQDLDLFTITKF